MPSDYTNDESFAEPGSFSKRELKVYAQKKGITKKVVAKLNKLKSISLEELENILQINIPPRIFYLITDFGLPAGSYLTQEVDWELVALVTNECSYMKHLIALDENADFIRYLTDSEKESLRILANTYRITLTINNRGLPNGYRDFSQSKNKKNQAY